MIFILISLLNINYIFILISNQSVLFLGMDWKSMTIPASLPLTTDYIPEDTSLKMDYLTSNYTLLCAADTERSSVCSSLMLFGGGGGGVMYENREDGV